MATNTNSTNITLSTGINLPPPQSPWVDQKTGNLSEYGYNYLLGLINQLAAALPTVSVGNNLEASGNTQATALALQAQWNDVDEASANSNGVILAALQQGQSQTVFNDSAVTINIYPPPGSEIDVLGANEPFSLASNGKATFDFITPLEIKSIVSA
jgi:hypothetical protein